MTTPAQPGPGSRSSGESDRHRELKRAAHVWAVAHGYRVSAMEVRLPSCRYRADVAAYRPARRGHTAQTAVFECKQARPDFLGDSADRRAAIDALAKLNKRRELLERQLGVHHPSLRLGESLFPEFDRIDFSQLNHRAHAKLIRDIRIMENRVFARSKFANLINWKVADACYAVAYPEVLEPAELPLGWGLLIAVESPGADGEKDRDIIVGEGQPPGQSNDTGHVDSESAAAYPAPPPRLKLIRKPGNLDTSDAARLALLERIAAVATRETNRHQNIGHDAIRQARQAREVTGK